MDADLRNQSNDYIQLKKNEDILKLYIRDENGVETGEYLEFNMADIELPLRYQTILEEEKKNRQNLKNQFTIIDKKQDHKGKKLMSANEEAKIKAMVDFYKREVEIYNMFLGDRGVEKLLNGRQISWDTLEEINDIISTYIIPKLDTNVESIKAKIMKKYSVDKKESDTLE